MFWACFSKNGLGDLVFVKGRMNSSDYIDINDRHLFNSAAQMGYENGEWYLLHDNGPQHTSRATV